MDASEQDLFEIAKLLIKNKADVNTQNKVFFCFDKFHLKK
jgi:hypothetical protein